MISRLFLLLLFRALFHLFLKFSRAFLSSSFFVLFISLPLSFIRPFLFSHFIFSLIDGYSSHFIIFDISSHSHFSLFDLTLAFSLSSFYFYIFFFYSSTFQIFTRSFRPLASVIPSIPPQHPRQSSPIPFSSPSIF